MEEYDKTLCTAFLDCTAFQRSYVYCYTYSCIAKILRLFLIFFFLNHNVGMIAFVYFSVERFLSGYSLRRLTLTHTSILTKISICVIGRNLVNLKIS